ncbi:MAG: hypothetical protein ACKV2T_21385 [Kofleriaceae bacterium]
MKAAIVILALCLTSHADAKPRSFGSFKLVSQRPALHKNRILHDRIRSLRDSVTACGQPVEGKPQRFPTMTLRVAADGSISDVVIEHNVNLSDDTVACIRKVVGTIHYPAQKKPSVVTWVLVYDR